MESRDVLGEPAHVGGEAAHHPRHDYQVAHYGWCCECIENPFKPHPAARPPSPLNPDTGGTQ